MGMINKKNSCTVWAQGLIDVKQAYILASLQAWALLVLVCARVMKGENYSARVIMSHGELIRPGHVRFDSNLLRVSNGQGGRRPLGRTNERWREEKEKGWGQATEEGLKVKTSVIIQSSYLGRLRRLIWGLKRRKERG